MAGGRPPEPVPQDVADALVAWVRDGRTIASFCKQPGRPVRSTIFYWMAEDKEFLRRVQEAREAGVEAMVDDAVEIADEGLNDTYIDENGNVRVESDVIQRSKLRSDLRMRIAASLRPARYGSKQAVEHSGKLSLDAIIGETLTKHAEKPPE